MVFKPGYNPGRGSDHPSWRGGVKHSHGYITVYKQSTKYVPEHRLVYEDSRNCCLLAWTLVHHKDGNRQNNIWYNLEAVTRGQHNTKHHMGNTYSKKDMSDRRCALCKSDRTAMGRGKKSIHLSPHWLRFDDGFICYKCYQRIKLNH